MSLIHYRAFWRKYRIFVWLITMMFFKNTLGSAATFAQEPLLFPPPGEMISISQPWDPLLMRGVRVYPDNPFQFDFLFDKNKTTLTEDQLNQESQKLVHYFLTSLTIPEGELWVNLSPFEEHRIISKNLGQTEMGRDLLAQDYLLKQLTASLMYPETELGRRFWNRIYQRAYEEYGTMDIPLDTFHKVWIVPDKAVVYQNEDTALVLESRFKVMVEEDYIAFEQSRHNSKLKVGRSKLNVHDQNNPKALTAEHPTFNSQHRRTNKIESKIIKEIILPELEQEINHGEQFGPLRQIYQAHILASWYKQALKESFLGKTYVDQQKVRGVDIVGDGITQKIYNQYIEAYQKGVYNYIKEERSFASESRTLPRKYFGGGIGLGWEGAQGNTKIRNDGMQVLSGQTQSPGQSSLGWLMNAIPSQLVVQSLHLGSNLASMVRPKTTATDIAMLSATELKDRLTASKAIREVTEIAVGDHSRMSEMIAPVFLQSLRNPKGPWIIYEGSLLPIAREIMVAFLADEHTQQNLKEVIGAHVQDRREQVDHLRFEIFNGEGVGIAAVLDNSDDLDRMIQRHNIFDILGGVLRTLDEWLVSYQEGLLRQRQKPFQMIEVGDVSSRPEGSEIASLNQLRLNMLVNIIALERTLTREGVNPLILDETGLSFFSWLENKIFAGTEDKIKQLLEKFLKENSLFRPLADGEILSFEDLEDLESIDDNRSIPIGVDIENGQPAPSKRALLTKIGIINIDDLTKFSVIKLRIPFSTHLETQYDKITPIYLVFYLNFESGLQAKSIFYHSVKS